MLDLPVTLAALPFCSSSALIQASSLQRLGNEALYRAAAVYCSTVGAVCRTNDPERYHVHLRPNVPAFKLNLFCMAGHRRRFIPVAHPSQ